MVDASVSLVPRGPTFGPVHRRRAALLAASVVFHIAVLMPLALRFFERPISRLDEDPRIPIYLELEPRPLLEGATARTRQAQATAREGPIPTVRQVFTDQPDRPGTQEQVEDAPSPPSPHLTAKAPADAATAAADPWQVTPETMRAAVARSLRLGAVGCRAMDGRLNPAEQRLCDDRFNEAASRAGPLGPRTLTPSEARRDAQFARDGARALAQYEARRRPLSGGVGILGPGDCTGSNLGVGCAGAHLDPAIRQGATTVANPGLGSNDLAPMRPVRGNE